MCEPTKPTVSPRSMGLKALLVTRPVADPRGMNPTEELRFVRDELESLAFLRLTGPLDLALQARYQALSTVEHELLHDAGAGLGGRYDQSAPPSLTIVAAERLQRPGVPNKADDDASSTTATASSTARNVTKVTAA
jgi:hypothetical protein